MRKANVTDSSSSTRRHSRIPVTRATMTIPRSAALVALTAALTLGACKKKEEAPGASPTAKEAPALSERDHAAIAQIDEAIASKSFTKIDAADSTCNTHSGPEIEKRCAELRKVGFAAVM